ncbi:unnamed protein product, partial [Ectocarpus sp. 12 AP-2014]
RKPGGLYNTQHAGQHKRQPILKQKKKWHRSTRACTCTLALNIKTPSKLDVLTCVPKHCVYYLLHTPIIQLTFLSVPKIARSPCVEHTSTRGRGNGNQIGGRSAIRRFFQQAGKRPSCACRIYTRIHTTKNTQRAVVFAHRNENNLVC